MPRKQREVEQSLRQKGFRSREGDHSYFVYWSQAGKKTAVFTKTSHGARELTDSLLAQMARQCRLSRADFDRLVDCPLTRADYELKLIAAAEIEAQG